MIKKIISESTGNALRVIWNFEFERGLSIYFVATADLILFLRPYAASRITYHRIIVSQNIQNSEIRQKISCQPNTPDTEL